MKILVVVLLLFMTQPLFAQIGGTQAVDDTMRLADKFAVYKVAEGQMIRVYDIDTDSVEVVDVLATPQFGSDPACSAGDLGKIITRTSVNVIKFCNGSNWVDLVVDNDSDGMTNVLDTDDNVSFATTNVSAGDIISGYSAYTGTPGVNLTLISGTMVNNGGGTITTDDIALGGYYDNKYVNVITDDNGGYTNAGTAQVLSGYEYWNSNGSRSVGTMPNNGSPTYTSNGTVGGAGYYSSVIVNVAPVGTNTVFNGNGWECGNDAYIRNEPDYLLMGKDYFCGERCSGKYVSCNQTLHFNLQGYGRYHSLQGGGGPYGAGYGELPDRGGRICHLNLGNAFKACQTITCLCP